jgi:nicotinamide riboside transporter PnuC
MELSPCIDYLVLTAIIGLGIGIWIGKQLHNENCKGEK